MAGRVGKLVSALQSCGRACGGRLGYSATELSLYDGIMSRGGSAASACQASTSSSTPSVMGTWRAMGLHRHYASDSGSQGTADIGSEKVQKLAQDILNLTVLESSQLTEILRKRLGLQKPAFGAMPVFAAGAAPMPAAPAAAPGAPAAAAPKEEKKAEKTTVELKLESFSAEGKVKVIKEIRSITSLGLKEAKELVEKAPVVIKSDIPNADAENMKKAIEAVGGKVTLS